MQGRAHPRLPRVRDVFILRACVRFGRASWLVDCPALLLRNFELSHEDAMHVDTMTVDRRRHPRTLSHTEAVVHDERSIWRYVVSNLSVGGGLFIGNTPQHAGKRVDVILQLPLYPEVRVHGDV